MSKNPKVEFLKSGKIRLVRDFGPVPADFICDGASIPRFFWRLSGHPFDKHHVRAGIWHDWRYTIGGTKDDRKAADKAYRELLKESGMCAVGAALEYLAVRLFGRKHFNFIKTSKLDN